MFSAPGAISEIVVCTHGGSCELSAQGFEYVLCFRGSMRPALGPHALPVAGLPCFLCHGTCNLVGKHCMDCGHGHATYCHGYNSLLHALLWDWHGALLPQLLLWLGGVCCVLLPVVTCVWQSCSLTNATCSSAHVPCCVVVPQLRAHE